VLKNGSEAGGEVVAGLVGVLGEETTGAVASALGAARPTFGLVTFDLGADGPTDSVGNVAAAFGSAVCSAVGCGNAATD
jgi:hypothetical protein